MKEWQWNWAEKSWWCSLLAYWYQKTENMLQTPSFGNSNMTWYLSKIWRSHLVNCLLSWSQWTEQGRNWSKWSKRELCNSLGSIVLYQILIQNLQDSGRVEGVLFNRKYWPKKNIFTTNSKKNSFKTLRLLITSRNFH